MLANYKLLIALRDQLKNLIKKPANFEPRKTINGGDGVRHKAVIRY